MIYDWKQAAEQEAAEAQPLPEGEHEVRIARVVLCRRDGAAFHSRAGDPQIMLVFQDDRQREAAVMYTLSRKAAWALAKVLSATGADLETMTRHGVEPERFAEERFARVQLVDRRLRVKVAYEQRDGREYARATPLAPMSMEPGGQNAPVATTASDDDIPF